MRQRSSEARGTLRRLGLALAAAALVGAAVSASALGGQKSAAISPPPSPNCHLANGIQHVIEITFDNTHFFRDNPNVLSDLEQMPALKDFITNNGTMLSNNYTPLIAHTADDSLTNYSGLYGDRHGQGIGNSYETYVNGDPNNSRSSFAYWTGTYNVDAYPNMPYSPVVPAVNSPQTPPAPWVPFTRAGCDVGDVSTANMVLENVNPDLQNVFGVNSPEVAQLNADTGDPRFKQQEQNDYVGLGVHCAENDSFCSTAMGNRGNQTVASSTAVPDLLPDEPGGYNNFLAVFGHRYLTPQLVQAANSGGDRVLNGHTYHVFDAQGNLTDLNGNTMKGPFAVDPCPPTPPATCPPNTGSKFTPGFPGFGPISAAQSLAYVADMQEVGVPITYGYISDAHERKRPEPSGCSNTGTAQGPGDSCYKANLAAYDAAFNTFFQRLADDGINASNTLFVITADEGDHFAGANANRHGAADLLRRARHAGLHVQLRGHVSETDRRDSGRRPRAAEPPGEQLDPFYNESQGNSDLHQEPARPDGRPRASSNVTSSARRPRVFDG